MEAQSLSLNVKRLEAQVRQILRPTDPRSLATKQRELIAGLQQDLASAKIYTQAYELSETPEEQLGNSKAAKKWLASARKSILSLSEYNIFSAIDVAHLSAQIEQIIDQLK